MDTKSRRRPRIAVPHGFHTGSLSLAEVRSTGWVPKLLPSTLLALVLLAGLASSPPAAGQVEGPPELGPGTELRTELRFEVTDVEDAWLEVMSLQPRGPASADPSPPFVALVGDRSSVDAELRLTPELPGGPAMVCAGAAGMAVGCERVYLHVGDGSRLPPPEAADLVIDVTFTGGVGVTGRYLLGGVAVPGAQVAVFPADLNAEVAYTLPLGWRVSSTGDSAGGGRLVRTAETDGDGRFLVPPLVGGRYVLETVLPSGRVHRSPPFEVPVVEPNLDSGPDETPAQGTGSSPGGGPDGEGAGVVSSSPAEGTAAPGSDPDKAAPPEGASELEREGAVDLGDFEVAEGLAVRFVVRDPFGDPIEGAVVSGRQGSTVHTLATYEARTNAEGDAALAGFTVGSPVRLTCGAEGYGTISTDYELVPVVVDCELAPLASIRGELAGVGGDVPPGAALSL
ncbi:MAG: carboxypeptidase-like regulatory domain-containing protein [Acidobacteriota bacterium]